ncbi:Fn3-like domain-containing protein [Marinobacter sp. CHS3-4]|uniref:fimbrial biogenesis chaperone n=1 Tax=Marinobacter sp. CHS3-4 TaxID=3045174 RepID=UPI0024B5F68D|nr:Fn3-like domain-containing protein [Marinobacter sp. CHS3-4]MDI9244471.1 Fn3-like domain-containing protein [Marinobacter sp. CHS3-4]
MKRIFLSLLLVLTSFSVSSEMLISPTRAILTMDQRSTSITLRNTSDGARTYRLSWEDKRVNSDGRYEAVEEGESWPSAASMIRFSPRQITVGPQENQTVRLNFRPPGDIEPGEYRSHLRLQVVAESSEPTSSFKMDHPENEGISMQLFMQMSFSLPVIARVGLEPPAVSISSVEVLPAENNEGMRLEVTVNRKGEASSFGDLTVEMQRNANSKVELIGRYKDLYLFPETSEKKVRVRLRDQRIQPGSWIRVAYEGEAEYSGILWDERIFQSK